MCKSQRYPLFTASRVYFHINEFSICLLSDYDYRFILIQINILLSDYVFLPRVSSHTDFAGTKQFWREQAQPSLRARVLINLTSAECGWSGSLDSEAQSLVCTGWEQTPHKCESIIDEYCAAVGWLNIPSCSFLSFAQKCLKCLI